MKKYWKSLDELQNVPDMGKENFEKKNKNEILDLFEGKIANASSSRRDFLKLLGFSVTSAAIVSACERPVHKAIPYVVHPEEIVPGKSLYYASSFFDGKDYCSIIVKNRDGRPIKIEGNPLSNFNGEGTTARVQASILSLYDDARLKAPLRDGKEISWEEMDEKVILELQSLDTTGKEICLLTSTLISPSTRSLIQEFGAKFNNFHWIQYDAISSSAISQASEISFGQRIIPGYRFDKADVVVSFGADFLGSWLAPVTYIRDYTKRRKLDENQKSMLRHYQLESCLSLTGSNADHRITLKPSDEKACLISLYNLIARKKGKSTLPGTDSPCEMNMIADELLMAGRNSLVVSSSNEIENQLIVNAINQVLGAVGNTVDFNKPLKLSAGNDEELITLMRNMKEGKTGALLMYNVNPVYDYPENDLFKEGLNNVSLSICMDVSMSETTEATSLVCPVDHYLESWGDFEVTPGEYSLSQPCIKRVFNSRSFQDSLLKWGGFMVSHHEYLKNYWKEFRYDGSVPFKDFWNKSLQNGIVIEKISGEWVPQFNEASLSRINKPIPVEPGYELVLKDSIRLGNGMHGNNPWLHELPDPVSKISWDQVLMISPADAVSEGLSNGDMVKIKDMGECPVFIQPGQAAGTLSIDLGYGRTHSGKVADFLGENFFRMIRFKDGQKIYWTPGIQLEKTGESIELALTQTHNSMEGRPIAREANLDEYLESPDAGNELHEEYESHHKTLYPDLEFDGYHWAMAIDLNACVGCSTCVIACQAENNTPVVGKDEVRRRRIMHWMKIDRYYSEDPENPKVSFQPMLCQHCDNAPCENVCPVSATNHSSEGLNQMSYNRCIGTKYCINNCPYRARRFNWFEYTNHKSFDYHTTSDLGRMVLNPDVTVRSRGVVEKCSFCVQRIQEKKLNAKLEDRDLKDGEIQPACAQACPANAIVFGNLKDPNSKISKLFKDPRNYHVLEQLHTLPSVGYLTKIRNEKARKES